jgi:hypothetical protein
LPAILGVIVKEKNPATITFMHYYADSRSYLQRARARLDEKNEEAIFYAAFELRCGIEARMQEYLGAQSHISKSKKSGWKIAKLGKTIERAFKLGDRIARIIITDSSTNETLQTLYYTPVTLSLRKSGQQLGDFLHAIQDHRKLDDLWWKSRRSFLESIYAELEKSNSGTLLGPPIVNPKGEIQLQVENGINGAGIANQQKLSYVGRKVVMKVDYIDTFPPHAGS